MESTNQDAGSAPSGEFKHALDYYLQCVRDRTESVAAFEKAQAAYAEEASKLPLPAIMKGPIVVVTDADSLEKAKRVLVMTEVGIGFERRATERLAELVDYRNAKADLAAKHQIDELGETALLGASMIQRALGKLLAAIGHDEPNTWDEAVTAYRLTQSGWQVLGSDYSNEEGDALSDVWHEYRDRLINFAAPSAAAYLEKVRIVVGELSNDEESMLFEDARALLADAERLFGKEAR
jgi:hypothetical protein